MNRTFANCLAVALLLTLASRAHGGTVYVGNNGVDSGSCGAKASPCRSITQAISNAAAGDEVIVGPGRYITESGAPGCGCFLAVNKRVILVSSAGAASTVVDATFFQVSTNVLIIGDGSEFGRPGKGFTVNNPDTATGNGITIDAKNVKVRGNQVIGEVRVNNPSDIKFPATGILALEANDGPMLIEANQVMLWGNSGITAPGQGKTISKNQVSQNSTGISVAGTSTTVGNIVTANTTGIVLGLAASAIGNAVYGNSHFGFIIASNSFTGTIHRNDISGNGCGISVSFSGLDVTDNWWGAPTGPGSAPADHVCEPPGATAVTTPFATTPFGVKAPIKP